MGAEILPEKVSIWNHPARIERNKFKFKSLSCWSFNVAVGCGHACRFCYVPDVSTIKQGPALKPYGVEDPDAEWGDYLLIRQWDRNCFRASLKRAENTPSSELNSDGNRAVMFCTTTDAYQVVKHKDPKRRAELQAHLDGMVREALEDILERSTINVRILTRSPMASQDFDLMAKFGKRLLFGMSLPTMDNKLARIYEPHAPSPSVRLSCLHAAKRQGLNIFVAMAPTYAECDNADLAVTLRAIKELNPVTVFHEPINIRAENVNRIEAHAASLGVKMQTQVFSTPEAWRRYNVGQLLKVHSLANVMGIKQLHLWPDPSLGSKECVAWATEKMHPGFEGWLNHWWTRISEWPA